MDNYYIAMFVLGNICMSDMMFCYLFILFYFCP